MAHPHAKLTVYARRLLIQRVVQEGWSVAQTAFTLGISRACAYKWLRRYDELGDAGLADRSSRPKQSPRALGAAVSTQILALRYATGDGPARPGPARPGLRLHASLGHRPPISRICQQPV